MCIIGAFFLFCFVFFRAYGSQHRNYRWAPNEVFCFYREIKFQDMIKMTS